MIFAEVIFITNKLDKEKLLTFLRDYTLHDFEISVHKLVMFIMAGNFDYKPKGAISKNAD